MSLSSAKRPKYKRGGHLRVRISSEERGLFDGAAQLLGLDLSAWTRIALRRAAIKDLKDAGRDVGRYLTKGGNP